MTNGSEDIPNLSDSSDFEGLNGTIAARAKRRAKVARSQDAKKQRAKVSVVNKVARKGVVTRELVEDQTQLILSSQEDSQEEEDDEISSQESNNDNSFEDLFRDPTPDDDDDEDVPSLDKLSASDIDPYKDVLTRTTLRAVGADAESGTEVEKMLRRNDPTDLDSSHSFIENLFSLISIIAFDSVYTQGKQLKTGEQDTLLRQGFVIQLSSLLMDSYLYDNLFSVCPGMFKGTDEDNPIGWPTPFLEYVNECMTQPLSGVMKNRSRVLVKLTLEEGCNHVFSQKIRTSAMNSRREINNRLSHLWRKNSQLASGETSSSLFDAIRHTCRERDAVVKAKAVLQRLSIYATPTLRMKSSDKYAEALTAKVTEILKVSKTDNFTPSYWLAFCLLGPPADSAHQIAILKMTGIETLQEKIIGIDDEVALNRYSRKTLKSAVQRNAAATEEVSALRRQDKDCRKPPRSTPSSTPSSSTPRDKNYHHVRHEIFTAQAAQPAVDREEKELRDIIALYQDLGKSLTGDYHYQTDIAMYTERLVRLKLSKLEKEM